jgi:hypothetical protein
MKHDDYVEFGREEVWKTHQIGIFSKELVVWCYWVRSPNSTPEELFNGLAGHCPVDMSWEDFRLAYDYIQRALKIYSPKEN